ncbi:hypothetical protein GCM10010193_32560 [Kitasatospora atroaurantiaca]|uniref:Peptidase inhibitor family I36 n=1 Tax=Kitasatospora atroaurantiaca TaxID=285545 RepID=A0A561ERK0_9ACTN|nr:hypothetical protein [Kitasatospora atroaurantiaca]TWE18238.1 hypothetical protein FB465_3291 [Kitasatospora atroaurantiaca]
MHLKKVTAVVSATSSLLLGGVIAAPAAHAGAYGCAGNQVYSATVYGNLGNSWQGKKIGNVYTYFDGTYNCTVFVKAVYVGTKTYTAVDISNQRNDTTQPFGGDRGNYASYAGPVKIDGRNTCVSEYAYAEDTNGTAMASWSPGWHSCG